MATFESKKWGKRAFYCDSCGYEFRKAWIEPMFMIRDFIQQDHEWYHNAATDENHPLVKAWVEWERKRIIKLLEDYFELTLLPNDRNQVEQNEEWDRGFHAAIALIKGQK